MSRIGMTKSKRTGAGPFLAQLHPYTHIHRLDTRLLWLYHFDRCGPSAAGIPFPVPPCIFPWPLVPLVVLLSLEVTD